MLNGFLRQSTASQIIVLGPFISDTDFKTAATALTISNTDIRLSKAGGAFGNKNSGGGTHAENGYYHATLDATDTATVGILKVNVNESGALAVTHNFYVLEEAIYDALFASGAAVVPANVTQWLGSAAATPTVAGVPEVDVTHAAGTILAGAFAGYIPSDVLLVDSSVLASHATGSFPADVLRAAGTLLATAASGYLPADARRVDGVALATHKIGTYPADVIAVAGDDAVVTAWNVILENMEALTVTTSTSNTTFSATLAAATTDDNYIDRVGIFKVDTTTAALRGRPFYVTDYVGSTKTFSVDQLNAVPAVGDTFVLLP